ncbi:MAG: hypothetical protein R3A11_05655 [Bdellovibrionota bacterium]
MFEGYTGSAEITFGIDGLGSDTYVPQTIFVTGNDAGDRVTLVGVLGNDRISIKKRLPEEILDVLNVQLAEKNIAANDDLSFAGFGGYPKDANTIMVDEIMGQSDGFKKLGFEVEGYFQKSGTRIIAELHIYQTVGSMKKNFPSALLGVFVASDSDLAIVEEPEDRNDVKFDLINFKLIDGQNLTVGG